MGPTLTKEELSNQIKDRMGGKGIGMNDVEWSKIVKENLKKLEQEEANSKQKKFKNAEVLRRQLDA